MKRDWRHPWFALLGSTGAINQRAFVVGDSVTIGPFPEDRRLYLFVNDATCYLCLWPWLGGGAWRLYENNSGTARIEVAPVASD